MPNETTPPIPLPVATRPEPPQPVLIKLDARAKAKLRKRKLEEQLAEAQAFQRVGSKIIRIKERSLAKIGKEMEEMGIKRVEHGRIAYVADNASKLLVECDHKLEEMQANNPALEPEVIVTMMRLQLEFNQQILETAEAHLRAEKQITVAPSANNLSIPFPVGQPMLVSVSPMQQKEQKAIEGAPVKE